MNRIALLAAIALPALAADAEPPLVTLSGAAQVQCAAGGGFYIVTRSKLVELAGKAFEMGEQSCKGPGL